MKKNKNEKSIYILSIDYNEQQQDAVTLANVQTGEILNTTIDKVFNIENSIMYVKDLDLDYKYITKYLFKNGMTAKIYDKTDNNDNVFTVLLSHNKKYAIFLNHNNEIRNFSSLLPHFDLEKVCEDEMTAMSLSILKCQQLGVRGLTIGSSAYNAWKFSSKESSKSAITRFNDNFTDKKIIEEIRQSYKAGINIYNEKNKWCDEKTITIDANSLYPFWLTKGDQIPYGKPKKLLGIEWMLKLKKGELQVQKEDGTCGENEGYNPQYRMAIGKYILSMKIKEGHTKTFGIKDEKNEYKYTYPDVVEGVFYLWDFEMEELRKHYDLEEEKLVEVLAFKTCESAKFFDTFFNKYRTIKEESEDYLTRQIAKLVNNNLVGKFGTKNKLSVNLEVKPGEFVYFESENYDYSIALASYVLAKARCYMSNLINLFGDSFVYCDTDSITFKGDKIPSFMSELMDEKEFGKFKIESVNDYIHILKCKCYEKKTEKGIKRVISGLPKNDLFNFEKFTKNGLKTTMHIWTTRNFKPELIEVPFIISEKE